MTQDEWRTSVNDRLGSIERRVTHIEKVGAVGEVHRSNVEKRLSSIEDTLKWLVRLVIGSVIAAAVAFALKGGFTL